MKFILVFSNGLRLKFKEIRDAYKFVDIFCLSNPHLTFRIENEKNEHHEGSHVHHGSYKVDQTQPSMGV
jgi:hypothetical protein